MMGDTELARGRSGDERTGHQGSGPTVITPADGQYLDMVSGINQRWQSQPEKVYLVRTTQQVVKAVQGAVSGNRRVSVRSGGHCFEDFVYNPDIRVVIDMSEMNDVYYDRQHNAVSVDAGATVLDLYDTLYKTWGVTIPAGFCHSVGMGGFVTGGGWGLLLRRDGLVVDHLYGVEVVVVNAAGKASSVVATRRPDDPNRELWWAHTGGGGGTFGVVTRFLFRSPGARGDDPSELLPKPPREVIMSAVAWPWAEVSKAEFFRLARNYASWHVDNIAPDNPNAALSSLLGLNHVSNGFLGALTQIDAETPNAERLLDDYLSYLNDGISVTPGPLTVAMGDFNAMPEFATSRRLPWLKATQFLSMDNPVVGNPTNRAEYKSAYMVGNFPDSQLEALYEHLTRPDIANPNVSVGLTPYGGRVAAVHPTDTAAVHRGAAFKMLWSAYWTDPADDEKYTGWANESYAETYADTGGVPVPNGVTDGCYVNYADIRLSDPKFNKSGLSAFDLYFKENYTRLRQVKKNYDPRDVFHHAQSVPLPDA